MTDQQNRVPQLIICLPASVVYAFFDEGWIEEHVCHLDLTLYNIASLMMHVILCVGTIPYLTVLKQFHSYSNECVAGLANK